MAKKVPTTKGYQLSSSKSRPRRNIRAEERAQLDAEFLARNKNTYLRHISLGIPGYLARQAAAFSPQRLKKLREEDPLFDDLCAQARIDCERRMLGRIDKASRKQWQAAAWRLERMAPGRYSIPYMIAELNRETAQAEANEAVTVVISEDGATMEPTLQSESEGA